MAKRLSTSSSSDPKTNFNEPGRIRSSRACLHCSRRKVKCDGLQPCNNCSKDSSACEYGVQKKRGPPKGCDPRGGRRKKIQEPPSEIKATPTTTTTKRKAPPSSDDLSAAHNPVVARNVSAEGLAQVGSKVSTAQRGATSSSSTRPPILSTESSSRTDGIRPPHEPFKRHFYPIERSLDPAPLSNNAPLTTRPSLEARVASNERLTTPSQSISLSKNAYDTQSTWSQPYSQPNVASPSLSRHSSYLAENVANTSVSSVHPFTQNSHATQHTSADLGQHVLQPQHSQQPYFDSQHAGHAWPFSSSGARFSQQQSTPPSQLYDTYPLQTSLREYHRPTPQIPHRSTLPPYATSSSASHPSPDVASQRVAERVPIGVPSSRTTTGTSASTFASPHSHTSRRWYDGPGDHYNTGTSMYERGPATPPSSSLSSRHPVSASRLTETSTSSIPASAQTIASISHITGVDASPAYTSPSHAYSPSSTALPHRPWYNSSQPHSPRDPASVSLSQNSSPGAHWLDPHARPSPASANYSLASSRLPLEDRLPRHIVQRLLDIYQVFVHPHWPILYLPSVTSLNSLKRSRPIVFEAILAVASNTFDAYSDSASEDGQQASNPVLELLYAQSPQGSEPAWKSNELRDHFVHRVKTRIFEGKFVQDIGTIQAAILISVIELGCGNTSSAFQFGGIACRMALDMNLHRCTLQTPSSSSSTHTETGRSNAATALTNDTYSGADQRRSGAQIQERLRVFWACFILDKVLSAALDKPAQLRTAEIEADWPSVQEADEYDLWINETTRKFVEKSQLAHLESVKVHALSSFKAWAEVMAIVERILEEVYSPQAKRDRRRTKGASDYEALLRLNGRLAKWRANLPPHLRWSGTWTSPDLLSSAALQTQSADRKESNPHRGLPPQILTMRAWYCICLILLHRPRVPKLLEGPTMRGALISEVQNVAAEKPGEASMTKEGSRNVAAENANARQSSAAKDKCPEPAGLDICNAAAKEVCDILHVYGSSFRMRKISSSWVYLIFQSATIHAAIAASKSVVAFKARQSGVWSRRGSKLGTNDLGLIVTETQHDLEPPVLEDTAGGSASAPETHHVTEAELEGSSELVKTSALYLAECVRYLKRIGPTWRSASNHVAVLRNLCIASAQARPSSPALPPVAAAHISTNGNQKAEDFEVKNKAKDGSVGSQAFSSTLGLPGDEHHHLMGHAVKESVPDATSGQRQNGVGDPRRSSHASAPQEQPLCHVNGGSREVAPHMEVVGPVPSNSAMGSADGIQGQFAQTQGYAAAGPHEAFLASRGVSDHPPFLQQQMPPSTYPINAYDASFWASMPVASEGYNEWDEFFKAFNPNAEAADFGSQRYYHPTAAMDLITALQDPNRLLSTVHQHQQQQH